MDWSNVLFGLGQNIGTGWRNRSNEREARLASEALQAYNNGQTGQDGQTGQTGQNNRGNGNTTGNAVGSVNANPGINADYNVDMNNPYSMAIMNAKNDYARAQNMGNQQAMNNAAQTAEAARQAAQAAGVPIQSFLATNGVDYATALDMQNQLRQAQNNDNQNFSYTSFAQQLANMQPTSPTTGVLEQNPVNAGTAQATVDRGVIAPSVGNQQTAQTISAPNTSDLTTMYNTYRNRLNGSGANPSFLMGARWGM